MTVPEPGDESSETNYGKQVWETKKTNLRRLAPKRKNRSRTEEFCLKLGYSQKFLDMERVWI